MDQGRGLLMDQWPGLVEDKWTFREEERRGPEDTPHTCIKQIRTALQNKATVVHTARRSEGGLHHLGVGLPLE